MNEIMFSRGGFPVITKYLFDNLMTETFNNDMLKMKSGYPMNIVECVEMKDNAEKVTGYRLEYALAGFNKNEIEIKVKDNILNIHVEKKERNYQEGNSQNYLRQGISYKEFDVSYKLMDGVDKEKIKVSYENGILYINLPLKQEEVNSYKIEIE